MRLKSRHDVDGNSSYLADHEFVTIIVAGQVREDAGSTCHHVDVVAAQQLDQGTKETLHPLLQTRTDECNSSS